MIKYISRFFMFTNEKPRQLGRWNLDYCKNKMNQKIDLSNEDHCGPCGQYAITKIEEKKKENIKNDSSHKLYLLDDNDIKSNK